MDGCANGADAMSARENVIVSGSQETTTYPSSCEARCANKC
jgi:hypothetical protein